MLRCVASLLILAAIGFAGGPSVAETQPFETSLAQAETLTKQGKYDKAIEAAAKALRLAERAFGRDDERLLPALRLLAQLYARQGQHAKAETEYRRTLAILKRSPEANSKEILAVKKNLAAIAAKQQAQKKAEAEAEAKKAEEARIAAEEQARKRTEAEAAELAIRQQAEAAREDRMQAARAPEITPDQAAPLGAALPEDNAGQTQTRSFHLRPSQAAHPPAAELRSQAVPPSGPSLLPTFPWPPPASSASYVFPKEVFGRYSTAGEVSSAILAALERSGYVERSFYQTPSEGIALVTRLEKIKDDGTPAAEGERWPAGLKANPADLFSFLRGLFYVAPGHFRVIVFILQDLSFWQSPTTITGQQAEDLLRKGANMLPPELASRSFANGTCTALIYEFASDGSAVKMVMSGLTGKQHLDKAGLLASLDK